MTIRSRLLLFLLPAMIGGIILITSILGYHWHNEILNGFKIRLKSAIVSCAAIIEPEEIMLHENDRFILKVTNPQASLLYEDFKNIKTELGITNLYLVYVDQKPSQTSPSIWEAKDLYHLKRINFKIMQDHIKTLSNTPFESSSINFLEDTFITPIYRSKDNFHKKMITGYAPIRDMHDNIIAYVAADVSIDIIYKKLQEGLTIILLTAGGLITILIFSLFFIANKIALPVQKLNNSALSIAAGQYGDKIEVTGPKEIVELSATLNTMSECLQENLNRLQENSFLKEKMYGEHESSILLQNHMLKKTIDECQSDAIAVKNVTILSANPSGFLLNFPEEETQEQIQIHAIEAKEKGFKGMYELLTKYKNFQENQNKKLDRKFPSLILSLDKKNKTISIIANKFQAPFLFSQKNLAIKKDFQQPLDAGDLFFIFNSGVFNFFRARENIENLLTKILRYFAEDGLETCANMLQKELSYICKKNPPAEDLQFICFQLLL